jgi:hypothetical protein
VTAVVKTYMYGEVEDRLKGSAGLDLGGLIIGT